MLAAQLVTALSAARLVAYRLVGTGEVQLRGHDPTGQFFHERVESVGLGIHFYF